MSVFLIVLRRTHCSKPNNQYSTTATYNCYISLQVRTLLFVQSKQIITKKVTKLN